MASLIVAGEEVARFVSERLGVSISPPYTTLGIERGGEIVAGCLFHCFEGPDIAVTVAGTGFTRAFIRTVGQYVFGQLGCVRMTVTTGDLKVVEYAHRLGGQTEGRLRSHFGPGADGIVVGILREEWKIGKVPAIPRA